VNHPDRKGKVESGVGSAKKTPLKGQRFESLEEAQAYLDHWEEHWADTRIHGTTKRRVATMFAEEKPALLPLPLEPFRYYKTWKKIARYLGRAVRTCQRWEKLEGLPVHRLHHTRLSSVYAVVAELDEWRRSRETAEATSAKGAV